MPVSCLRSCRTSSWRCRHSSSASCLEATAASRRDCRDDESCWDACSCCCSFCWSSLQTSSCCLTPVQQGVCQGVQQGHFGGRRRVVSGCTGLQVWVHSIHVCLCRGMGVLRFTGIMLACTARVLQCTACILGAQQGALGCTVGVWLHVL